MELKIGTRSSGGVAGKQRGKAGKRRRGRSLDAREFVRLANSFPEVL